MRERRNGGGRVKCTQMNLTSNLSTKGVQWLGGDEKHPVGCWCFQIHQVTLGLDRQFLMICVFRDLIKASIRERCNARSPCVIQTAGFHSRSQLEKRHRLARNQDSRLWCRGGRGQTKISADTGQIDVSIMTCLHGCMDAENIDDMDLQLIT